MDQQQTPTGEKDSKGRLPIAAWFASLFGGSLWVSIPTTVAVAAAAVGGGVVVAGVIGGNGGSTPQAAPSTSASAPAQVVPQVPHVQPTTPTDSPSPSPTAPPVVVVVPTTNAPTLAPVATTTPTPDVTVTVSPTPSPTPTAAPDPAPSPTQPPQPVPLSLDTTVDTPLSTSGMTPGDVVTRTLLISNSGSQNARYAMVSHVSNSAAGSVIQMYVKTGVSDCSNTGFANSGQSLYSGALGSTSGQAIFGNPSTGQQAGDRTLNSGQSEMLCVQVAVPTSAGNSLQGSTVSASFDFPAEAILP